MRYFIYAYPEMYGGLHGMYNYELTDDIDYAAACEWGSDLAHDTVTQFLHEDEIYSHEDYMQDNYNGAEWDDRYEEDYWDTFNEVMEEQSSFSIWPLKDGVTEEDYIKWQKENMEPRDFIERYCRELTEEDCK